MKVLLDIPDQKAAALLDVLQHISYVKAQPLTEEADDFDAPMEEFAEQAETIPIELMFGRMRGEIWMADDFDAPMEEFEEYM